MQQFNPFRTTKQTQQARRTSHDPVLTAEDEAFLQNVTSSESAAQEPSLSREGSAPAAVTDNQREISPVEEFGKEMGEAERRRRSTMEDVTSPTNGGSSEKRRRSWSWWRKSPEKQGESSKEPAPATLDSSSPAETDKETKKENEDMTEILDRLNLAADNNRVFSISDETQELLRKFKLIFKDLINGVPTAYHDLEMLLTNGNRQLQDTYTQLPGFLQKLIEKLPERWTESLAPEMIAAATAKASQSGVDVDNIGKAAAAANKMGLKVPSLKELVGKPAAIVGLLKSIMAFLRARFPAVLGMNVLWSLALFILLFVLWYCHKRGREVRLENERLVTEEEIGKMNQESSDGRQIRSTETLTTTAPQGASATEVREGIKETHRVRETTNSSGEGVQKRPSGVENAPPPARSKSILSIFGRTGNARPAATSKIEPYPGT